MSNLLQQKYPGVEVIPSAYPVAPAKVLLSNVLTAIMFASLALVAAADKILPTLGLPIPAYYTQNVAPNKFAACMGVYFLGNMLIQNLQSSRAFEIYFDGSLMFSKLQHGRMPELVEITQPIDERMQMVAAALGMQAGNLAEGLARALGGAPT